jgi:signal transduction histidine kinase
MGRRTFVLLVADDTTDVALVRETLAREAEDVTVTEARSRAAFLKMLEVATYDIVVASHKLADLNGLQVVDELRRRGEKVPVVLLVHTGTEHVAIEAMRLGVRDYVILRPPFVGRLPFMVQHAAWMSRLEHVTRQAEQEGQRLEQQLSRARRMEALDNLASSIAHDLNNVLLAIFGYAELVRDEVPDTAPARKNLESLLAAAERGRRLVGEILTFSGRGLEELEPLDFSELVHSTLLALRPSINPDIVIREHLAAGLPPVRGDDAQLRQIVINLVRNALEAMEESGGMLELTVEQPDEQGHGPEGAQLELRVRDTGHGMDEATRERVFDPFFSTKGSGGGAGLGLSIVYGIARRHGGVVRIESQRGKGSVVRVSLPTVLVPIGS